MKLKLAVIGCGIKASQYIETWIARDDINLVAVSDVNQQAMDAVSTLCSGQSTASPRTYLQWQTLLTDEQENIDAVYICTPHAFHGDQAVQALQQHDVLLEKPMVTSVPEAEAVIDAKNNSNKTLVVAYQGGLSPLTHQLARDITANTYGEIISINATIWEDWATKYSGGHWKQRPEISGGGFMFDTGAHLMNTVAMVCGSDIARISAMMENRNQPVDVVTSAIGRLRNNKLFTLHASGESIPVCESRIEIFFSQAIVRLCAWGRWIEIERPGKQIERIEQESANNLMDIFLQVRDGKRNNPSPAEQGLKMAKLWDAIKESAAQDGLPVDC